MPPIAVRDRARDVLALGGGQALAAELPPVSQRMPVSSRSGGQQAEGHVVGAVDAAHASLTVLVGVLAATAASVLATRRSDRSVTGAAH